MKEEKTPLLHFCVCFQVHNKRLQAWSFTSFSKWVGYHSEIVQCNMLCGRETYSGKHNSMTYILQGPNFTELKSSAFCLATISRIPVTCHMWDCILAGDRLLCFLLCLANFCAKQLYEIGAQDLGYCVWRSSGNWTQRDAIHLQFSQ